MEVPASHPAPHMLLDDGGLVLPKDLAGDKHTPGEFALQDRGKKGSCTVLGRAKVSEIQPP